MDKDMPDVLQRFQVDYPNVDELTEGNLRDFLNADKEGKDYKEHVWRDGNRTDQLRTRKAEGRGGRARVASDWGRFGSIVRSGDIGAYDRFIGSHKLPSSYLGKARERMGDSILDIYNRGDLNALRNLSVSNDSELGRQAEARAYNLFGNLVKDARDSDNVVALRNLREQATGDFADYLDSIDRGIAHATPKMEKSQ